MVEQERLVTFELLGQEYTFYSAASEEEIKSILSLVQQLVEENSPQQVGTLPAIKVAVLACLNIASRFVKLEQEFKEYKLDSEKRFTRLNDEIRTKLIVE